jgi:hypothetical protein
LKKCKFGVSEVDFLGLVLRAGEIAMDPTKLDGIKNWPTPTTVKEVRSFLGFANFYRKFINNYSDIARPLIDMTKKDKTWNWSGSCQNAFNRLKNIFLSEPVLRLPDPSKPFAIATDASKFATGGVLLQTDSNGEWHPFIVFVFIYLKKYNHIRVTSSAFQVFEQLIHACKLRFGSKNVHCHCTVVVRGAASGRRFNQQHSDISFPNMENFLFTFAFGPRYTERDHKRHTYRL